MPLETMLEAERYGQLSEREEQLAKEIREDMNERFETVMATIVEELEYFENKVEEIREDLEADIGNGLGGRYSPLELIDDKDVKKRYETAINDLDKLETKMIEWRQETEKEELGE